MSWTDILFPGNPGRREEVVRLSTKLHNLMEFNFEATNDLIDLLNKEAKLSNTIAKIYVDNTATVKENCQTILDKMNEVMRVVDKIDEDLAKKLEPEAYRKLKLPNMKFKDRIALAKKTVTAGLTVGMPVAGVVLIGVIKSGLILTKIVVAVGEITSCAVATLVLGVLTLGLDMIGSAIIGAIERNNLEAAIDELNKAMNTFDPASKEYTKTITRVEIQLETILGDDF